MATCDMSKQRQHGKEKPSFHIPANFNERPVDPKAYDRFTQLLLGGHIKVRLTRHRVMLRLVETPKSLFFLQ